MLGSGDRYINTLNPFSLSSVTAHSHLPMPHCAHKPNSTAQHTAAAVLPDPSPNHLDTVLGKRKHGHLTKHGITSTHSPYSPSASSSGPSVRRLLLVSSTDPAEDERLWQTHTSLPAHLLFGCLHLLHSSSVNGTSRCKADKHMDQNISC